MNNVLFIRHGESMSNAGSLKASSGDHLNGLTKKGQEQIEYVAKTLKTKIDAVYTSPYNRTLLSAETFVKNRHEELVSIVDDRLREINYGEYIDNRNSPEMEYIAGRQIAGDYEISFGETGENKREIVTRFMAFILRVIDENKSNSNIVVFSHGRAISIFEHEFTKLFGVKSYHTHTDNGSINKIIVFKKYRKTIKDYIEELNRNEIKNRQKIVAESLNRSSEENTIKLYKDIIMDIAKHNFDDVDLTKEVLSQFCRGLFESKIKRIHNANINASKSANEVILLVVFQNSSSFIKHFITHYKKIGVKNFVFIDNNSTDDSINAIRSNSQNIKVDIWQTKDRFDAIRAMGWKQRIIGYYGVDRWYLNLDIDELFIFRKNIDYAIQFTKDNGWSALGSVMIDMYPKETFSDIDKIDYNDIIKKYCYYDTDNYKKIGNQKYQYRIFGGPRNRIFGVSPSLQKFPLIFAKRSTLGINPHFWYPYSINLKSSFCSGLLHYKFLPNDLEKYKKYVISGIHWNNSSQYRSYVKYIEANPNAGFYDDDISGVCTNLSAPLGITDNSGFRIMQDPEIV